ncbi:hypothetical protein QR680_012110 [Steinernema hermaphroditum]|uniref:Uncharacterized protein n=1 Tax=Steinernema hermaphroditum TaxID=289476 RepID=A0AA39M064_9BILA|nr:hypothetical protein QR680_012110 [Steinernema hermaphroditum]
MNNLNLYFYKHLFQLLQVESVQEVAKLSEGNPIADDAWDFTVAYEPTSLLIAFDFKQRSHCFLYRDESAVDERKLRNVDSLRIDTVSFVFGDAGLHLPKHAKILSGIDEVRDLLRKCTSPQCHLKIGENMKISSRKLEQFGLPLERIAELTICRDTQILDELSKTSLRRVNFLKQGAFQQRFKTVCRRYIDLQIRCDSSFDEAGKYTLYCFKELVSELPEADWNIEVSMTDCTMADSHWKTKLQRTQSGDFMVILKCGDLETQTINPRNVRKQ